MLENEHNVLDYIRSRDQEAQDYYKEPMRRAISPIRQQGTKPCPGRAQIGINGSI